MEKMYDVNQFVFNSRDSRVSSEKEKSFHKENFATFLIHFCITFARKKCEIDAKKLRKIENFKKQLQNFYKNIFAFSQCLLKIFAFSRIFLSKFCNKVCKMRSKIFTFFEKIFVGWKP